LSQSPALKNTTLQNLHSLRKFPPKTAVQIIVVVAVAKSTVEIHSTEHSYQNGDHELDRKPFPLSVFSLHPVFSTLLKKASAERNLPPWHIFLQV
jgi:hypothetical protein